MASIYTKTAKGTDEVATRAHRLTPRQRSLLILVNGQRSDTELRQALGDALDETFATLLQGGFVERAGPAAPPPAAAPARVSAAPLAAAPASAPKPAADDAALRQRKRQAANALIDSVGPMAEALAMRMERAADATELDALIETAATTISNTRGARAAQDYANRFTTSAAGRP